jgi:hypothetical protein
MKLLPLLLLAAAAAAAACQDYRDTHIWVK